VSDPKFNLKQKKIEMIKAALKEFHWDVPKVAEALGISRAGLYRIIAQEGLDEAHRERCPTCNRLYVIPKMFSKIDKILSED
jgi:predicted transcriptional regulator